MEYRALDEVTKDVVGCRLCRRLVKYRETVARRASFSEQHYWRRPVAGFGAPNASLVIVGLAPAAHGGNRTGRVFTGDESGRFLVRALCEAGFANQPTSESRDDGLLLRDCYLTAAVKCAPPQNKPTADEFRNCSLYLDAELSLLTNARALLALGRLAFGALADLARRRGGILPGLKFAHGKRYPLKGLPTLFASYHPSPRNTYTGKLTMPMLVELLKRIKKETTTEPAPGFYSPPKVLPSEL